LPVKNTEANMPATEEKSVTNSNTSEMLGMDKKSIEQAAVRHYDNHHLRLSSVGKGRTKPSGKKPLW